MLQKHVLHHRRGKKHIHCILYSLLEQKANECKMLTWLASRYIPELCKTKLKCIHHIFICFLILYKYIIDVINHSTTGTAKYNQEKWKLKFFCTQKSTSSMTNQLTQQFNQMQCGILSITDEESSNMVNLSFQKIKRLCQK